MTATEKGDKKKDYWIDTFLKSFDHEAFNFSFILENQKSRPC